jgi:transposase
MKDTQKSRRIIMWNKVKELSEIGLNKSQIAIELSIDRKTVKKMLRMSLDEYLALQPEGRTKKLEPYESFIYDLLDEFPFLSSAVIEDRLKEHHSNLSEISSKTVYNYVMQVRSKYNIDKVSESKVRMMRKWADTPYGEWGQVDFGTMVLITDSGKNHRVHFFVMVLGRSRQKYVYFQSTPFTSRTAIYAHQLSFEYFCGAPQKLLYDQDRVFTKGENFGDIVLTQEFGRYSGDEVFTPVFCRKADPQTKGKVENVVKYIKQNFLIARKYHSDDQLNREVIDWLSRTGNGKVNKGTELVPQEEWEKEREYLLLPRISPVKPEPEYREYIVRKDHTIRYKGNYYSLPRGSYHGDGSVVRLYVNEDKLIITTSSGESLAEHLIPQTKGGYVSSINHWKIPDISSSELYEQVLSGLGNTDDANTWIQLLADKKRRYLKDNLVSLKHSIGKYDKEIVNKTLEICIDRSIYNAAGFADVAKTLYGQMAVKVVPAKTNMTTLRKIAMEPQTRDINSYQSIMSW